MCKNFIIKERYKWQDFVSFHFVFAVNYICDENTLYGISIFGCNMGMRDLPDGYMPEAQGHTYQANYELHMLQLLCNKKNFHYHSNNTSRLNARSNIVTLVCEVINTNC